VYETDGILVALTGLPDPTLSVALVERDPEDPAAALARAASLFDRHGRRLALDLERGRHPAVELAARRLGLEPVASRPAMTLALDRFRLPPAPPEVSVARVADPAGLRAVVQVHERAFGWPRPVAEGFFPPAVLSVPGMRLYVAAIDGVPVSCAVAHLDEGAVGIFGVGTLPWARRRGLATAVTAAALAEARGEADLAWLQSTPEGRGLYRRMGFRPVGEWVVWAS
jgi:GNAT superfamily N-acetyltransferase